MIYFIHPTARVLRDADYLARRQSLCLQRLGVPTTQQMDQYITKHNIFTFEQKRRREELQKTLSKMNLGRSLILLQPEDEAVEQSLVEILNGERLLLGTRFYKEEFRSDHPLYQELRKLNQILNYYHQFTTQQQAQEVRIRYLLSQCVYDYETRKLRWPSFESLSQDDQVAGMKTLTQEFMNFLSGFPSKLIRLVSRSPQWFTRWISATQTGSQLFQGPITDWNPNQVALCYWSMFYENLSQNPEAPRGEKLRDDDWVDQWVEQDSQKREQSRSARNSNVKQPQMGTPDQEDKFMFRRK